MTLIRPFRALRPVPTRAREVIAPPYDVLSSAEARERVKGKPWSFLHVSKAEIDLPDGTDPYAQIVYATAAETLERMRREGILMRDANPYYYVYRAASTSGRQTGIACVASLEAYASDRIKRHELTTPVKETDRVNQIEALNAQTGPVMMAYPHAPELDRALKRATERDPDVAVTADDDVTHELWVIGEPAAIARFTSLFDALPAIYIGDGHHRTAAAARVAEARGGEAAGSHGYFLSVIFPHHEMTILDYNRVIRDLNGRTPEQLLAEISVNFAVTPSASPARPASSSEFGMFLGGRWHRLKLRGDLIPHDAHIGRLPPSRLK